MADSDLRYIECSFTAEAGDEVPADLSPDPGKHADGITFTAEEE